MLQCCRSRHTLDVFIGTPVRDGFTTSVREGRAIQKVPSFWNSPRNSAATWARSRASSWFFFRKAAHVVASQHLARVHRSWQFLTGDAFDMSDAMLVSLDSIVARDSTLRELGGMQPGWMAWRDAPDAPWSRQAEAQQTEELGSGHHAAMPVI